MADPQPKKLYFLYEYADDYRVLPCNGVSGGVTPRGDIKADFFVESLQLQMQGHEVRPDGSIGDVVEREPSDNSTIIRRVEAGVLLSVEQAEFIGRWLIEKANDYRKATAGVKAAEAPKQ